MLRVKQGEVHLMGSLFIRHGRGMFTYFIRNTGSRADSEDLLQTLFERMIKYRKTYRGDAKFSTWMYQIASNLLIDYTKKKEKKLQKLKGFGKEKEKNDITHPLSITDDKAIQNEILEQALSRLPTDQREVLILGKYQGLRYKEVAKIMDCSEGAVKVRIYRAINELKEICHQIAKELNYEL